MPEKTTLSSTNKSCFPWAVVEMKRHAKTYDGSVERCYCQAANAAAAALELRAQLFDKLSGDILLQPPLPPVIAFTCIGPIVKVWLAYQDKLSLRPGCNILYLEKLKQVRKSIYASNLKLTSCSIWSVYGLHLDY
jgi:hypothetical protein